MAVEAYARRRENMSLPKRYPPSACAFAWPWDSAAALRPSLAGGCWKGGLRCPVRRGKPERAGAGRGGARRPGTVCGCGQRDQRHGDGLSVRLGPGEQVRLRLGRPGRDAPGGPFREDPRGGGDGGASTWHNGLIEREDNQRYCLREGKLVSLEQELGSRDMTRPETLRDFVRFCAEEYPADRYILLLWDHGGGALGGFGYDERYPDSPAMDLAQLDQALGGGGGAL